MWANDVLSDVLNALLDQLRQGGGVHGAVETIALQEVGAGDAEKVGLGLGLHPLADHLHAQRPPHACDRVDDGRRAGVDAAVVDEALIDLEGVERQVPKGVQTGEACAEIVQRDRDPDG